MKKRTYLKTSLLALAAFWGSVSVAHASVVLSEDFAAIDDWVFDGNSDGTGGNVATTFAGGNTLFHEEVAAADNDNEGTLTRTISTIGFTDITFDFSISQFAGGTYEGAESFDISVDTGSGFVSLANVSARLSTGLAGTATVADRIDLSGIALDAGADNGSFDVLITINTGFWVASGTGRVSREEYILEDMVINGSLIPEPGTYALLAGLTGLCFVIVRRRRS